ncbi:MAG: ribosome biogenesis GTPase YlqF [Victivallales bacterium]|nr:ribosome biogenesis GTPase YlqF [Victivallales bacterium]
MEDDFERFPLTGWFPGHMFKAGQKMEEALGLVDMAVELVDARAPFLTRNPDLRRILANKPFQLIANKADLASPAACRAWESHCGENGLTIHFQDSRRTANVRSLPAIWRKMVLDARQARGATRPLLRPVRVIIAGVPNIGKSTLVNHLGEKNRAQVGPKPGVTRTNQWIPIGNGVELLDTPGILWPKIRNKKHELLLGLLNILNDELLPPELLAEYLAWELERQSIPIKWDAYGLEGAPSDANQLLETIAKKRSFIKPGGKLDTERAAITFVKEFRDGKLGRITLEMPPVASAIPDGKS